MNKKFLCTTKTNIININFINDMIKYNKNKIDI